MVYTYRPSLGSEEESVQSTQPLNYTHGHFSSITDTGSRDTFPGKQKMASARLHKTCDVFSCLTIYFCKLTLLHSTL